MIAQVTAMDAEFDHISNNVRAELARAKVSAASMIMQMSGRGMPMNGPKWQRRMGKPNLWTLDEIRTIAAILGIPLERLTRPEE